MKQLFKHLDYGKQYYFSIRHMPNEPAGIELYAGISKSAINATDIVLNHGDHNENISSRAFENQKY